MELGDFAMNVAVHPGSRYAAVLHCGYGRHEVVVEVVVVDVIRERVVSRVELEEGFYGITFDPAGTRLFVSGAGTESVVEFEFRNGFLVELRKWALKSEQERGIPSGLATTPDGRRLWVANVLGQSVSEVDLEHPQKRPEELVLGARGTPGNIGEGDAWKDFDDD